MQRRNWPKLRRSRGVSGWCFSYLILLRHTACGLVYCHSNIGVLISSPEPAPGLGPQRDWSSLLGAGWISSLLRCGFTGEKHG